MTAPAQPLHAPCPAFAIGDTAWTGRYERKERWIPCPDCCGQKALTVILGDGSQVSIDCICAWPAYGARAGSVVTYDYDPVVEQIVIDGIEVRMGRPTEYKFNATECSYRTVNETNVFHDREGAMARAMERKAEQEAEEAKRMASKEKGDHTWAWNVTYHRRELKRAIHGVEYHTAKLNVAKAKTEKPA